MGISINEAIKDPFFSMEPAERGLINLMLTHGKKTNELFKDRLNDPQVLIEFGKDVDYNMIAEKMKFAFQGGLGIGDAIFDRTDNYGVQLDYVIDKALIKSLKVTRPLFKHETNQRLGMLEREKWITEKIVESLWDRLPDEMKQEIAKNIEKILIEKGIDPAKASQTTVALATGGLTLARSILGFQFHILVAQISNIFWKVIFGRGLSLMANATLQKLVGIFFGPIGWVITGILLLPTITGLIMPREYDKYVPAVFLIGLKRLQDNG